MFKGLRMSFQAMDWAMKQEVGNSTGKLLLLMIANYADARGECFPGQKTLAKMCEVTDRSVREWLAEFETRGLIEREERRRSSGYRSSDTIRLKMGLPEQSSAENESIAEPSSDLTGTTFRAKLNPSVNPKSKKSGNDPTEPLVKVMKIHGYELWDELVKLRGSDTPSETWHFPESMVEKAKENLARRMN